AVVLFAILACAAAKPHILAGAPVAFAAPAPVITATSSQVVARNHNGIAFAPVVAPAAIAPVAPLAKVVAPVAAALLAAPIAPLAAPAPLIARYAAGRQKSSF
ncbi:angiomotin-like, partial [Ceratitis capitata]|uniref:angiomotin-like n=1 Tax=Ceratitis capitata TaxID=7213 RepID=UPI000C6C4D4C